MRLDDQAVRAQVAQIEGRLAELETMADSACRAVALEIVQRLVELYGEGLARLLGYATQVGGAALLETLVEDELLTHLLMLHDLHPEDVATRVQRALVEVQPTLAMHGGRVELLGVEAGIAHLRLAGSCQGCAASATTLESTIKEAIERHAPDLLGIETAGVVPPTAAAFIPVSSLLEPDIHG